MQASPSILTKELKLQNVPGIGRRLRLSTNFLESFGFSPESRIDIEFRSRRASIVLAPNGTWKVHQRAYRRRKNNPTEAVVEIANQAILSKLAPASCERVHFTFTHGRIDIKPVKNQLFHIRKSFRKTEGLDAFMALSSGIDARAFSDSGFRIAAALEYRPNEARDRQDLTETGLCTFLRNNPAKIAFNEDIASIDIETACATVDRIIGQIACLSIGLQCDDFSSAKSARLKELEMREFRPGSRELGYYAAKLIERLRPASVLIENVPGWHGSESQAILGAVLSRAGYDVAAKVLDGADFGGLTKRKRCYFVASAFPGFRFPSPTGRNKVPLGVLLQDQVPLMRDLSHTKTVAGAIASKRARFTTLDAFQAPTVLKSQARNAKDSVLFRKGEKILRPTLESLKRLHDIPEDFSFDQVSEELAIEQTGQGIEYPLHRSVACALAEHLRVNRGRLTQLDLHL